ncbi:MAG: chorismate mutase [Methylobacteriaceae bacterium]|nr:chorismate mutase [Methylobacteriaceae bacterium]
MSDTALAEIRREIDRIDEAMHGLLMERGELIGRLMATKGTVQSGAAFRPDREASMMRALALRHRGLLPLDTAEGIWRVIIATFTYVQAPFAVQADISGGDAPMRDAARFHFGFTVPYEPRASGSEVIAAVARSRGDLGLVRLDQGARAGAWWRKLEGWDAPRVIARLPFIERPDHPAGTPLLVVSRPLAAPGARDVILWSVRAPRWSAAAEDAVLAAGGEVLASAGEPDGLAALLAVPGDVDRDALTRLFAGAGAPITSLGEIGAHAERFRAPAAEPPHGR